MIRENITLDRYTYHRLFELKKMYEGKKYLVSIHVEENDRPRREEFHFIVADEFMDVNAYMRREFLAEVTRYERKGFKIKKFECSHHTCYAELHKITKKIWVPEVEDYLLDGIIASISIAISELNEEEKR